MMTCKVINMTSVQNVAQVSGDIIQHVYSF